MQVIKSVSSFLVPVFFVVSSVAVAQPTTQPVRLDSKAVASENVGLPPATADKDNDAEGAAKSPPRVTKAELEAMLADMPSADRSRLVPDVAGVTLGRAATDKTPKPLFIIKTKEDSGETPFHERQCVRFGGRVIDLGITSITDSTKEVSKIPKWQYGRKKLVLFASDTFEPDKDDSATFTVSAIVLGSAAIDDADQSDKWTSGVEGLEVPKTLWFKASDGSVVRVLIEQSR